MGDDDEPGRDNGGGRRREDVLRELSALGPRYADLTDELDEIRKRMTAAVRDGFALSLTAAQMSAVSGLSGSRIYQMRDGRR